MKNSKVEIVCQNCGEKVMMHSYRVKNGNGKYCNQKCYLEARWKQNGKCKECGKPCSTRFCTPKCQKRFWDKNGYTIQRKQNYYWKKKFEIIEGLGGECKECGFNDHRALDIHHIDPSLKLIPKDKAYSWSRRIKDWKANEGNLELLCSNCHRLHTWTQRGFGPK